VANLSDEVVAIRVVSYLEELVDEIVNTTVVPSEKLFDLSYRTWVSML
jgi:hypothetical protein